VAVTDTTPPETTIDSGPSATTNETTAIFTCSASEVGATFECRLDGSEYSACNSPRTYVSLAAGAHSFYVRARDTSGNVDATPAERTWTVSPPPPPPAPPETSLDSHPAATTTATTATFAFSSTTAGAHFECSLDGGAFAPCSSPQTQQALAVGLHDFAVRAVDAVGNTDPTPATWSWTISAPADTTPPETSIDSGPSGTIESTTATFTFSASETGARFECAIDARAFSACSSPKT